MASNTGTTSSAFRFLDLPAELRNRIYEFVFVDSSEKAVNLFAVRGLLPSPVLLQVSRQIRQETQKLHQEATVAFTSNHRIRTCVSSTSRPAVISRLKNNRLVQAECEKLQRVLGSVFQALEFGMHYADHKEWNMKICVDMDAEGAGLWTRTDWTDRSASETPNLYLGLSKVTQKWMTENGRSMTEDGLDIEACLQTVFATL